MLEIVIAWILYTLDAPWWVWVVFGCKVLFELRSVPFYLRLVRADKRGLFGD